MKIKLVFTLLICMSSIVFSQAEDKIKKCIDLYESDPNKATKKLKKLIDKAGDNASYVAWDIYVEMYETTYNKKLEKGMSEFEYALAQNDLNILLRAKEKMEESNETDTDDYFLLMSKLEEIQLAVSNPNFYISYPEYQQLSEVCREASLKSKSVRADANLRAIYITYDPDTMKVDSIDVIAYSNAYEELKAGHLENSKKLLSSLILKYPNSYNINMSYYLYHSYKEQMDSAKMYLKKTIDLYPQQIEPRENLAKILFGEGNIFRAKKQIEELMVLYPGQDMKAYYSEVLFVEDKKMDEKRIIRPVYPNQIGVTYPAVKSHWGDYQAAMFKVATFTDPTGIIKKNDITNEKYLEIYCWKKMLDKNREKKPDELAFAYAMEEKGLLDCYVFYSNFHIDFAVQTQDFLNSESNRERMKKFVKENLIGLAE